MKLNRLVSAIWVVAAMTAVCTQPAVSEERRSEMPPQTSAPSAYVKPKITHEPYGEIKAVVPLISEDKGLQRMKLANISVLVYPPTRETASANSRRTSSAVAFRAGFPVRSIAATGSTLATSTL